MNVFEFFKKFSVHNMIYDNIVENEQKILLFKIRRVTPPLGEGQNSKMETLNVTWRFLPGPKARAFGTFISIYVS